MFGVLSPIEGLADFTQVLDEWPDDQRRAIVTLYALRGELHDRGFVGIARNNAGGVVASRVFVYNEEGLRALNPREVQRIQKRMGISQRVRKVLAAVGLGILLAACIVRPSTPPSPDSTSALGNSPSPLIVNDCAVVIPSRLPSGAPAGEPRLAPDGRVAWGTGLDEITEAVGELAFGDPDKLGIGPGSNQRVEIRGSPGVLLPVGDDGVGVMAITWRTGRCGYTLWLAPGRGLEEALEFVDGL